MVAPHEFSTEKLYHFICGECKNWWSHATDMIYGPVHHMWCPHCGVKSMVMHKNDGTNPRWERDVT